MHVMICITASKYPALSPYNFVANSPSVVIVSCLNRLRVLTSNHIVYMFVIDRMAVPTNAVMMPESAMNFDETSAVMPTKVLQTLANVRKSGDVRMLAFSA